MKFSNTSPRVGIRKIEAHSKNTKLFSFFVHYAHGIIFRGELINPKYILNRAIREHVSCGTPICIPVPTDVLAGLILYENFVWKLREEGCQTQRRIRSSWTKIHSENHPDDDRSFTAHQTQ